MMSLRAVDAGLFNCRYCGLLSRSPAVLPARHEMRCPRCQARIYARIPGSVARTWAFLLAAYALYLPANLLPFMRTTTLFGVYHDTVMSGIVYLWTSGSWLVAAVVFVASIVVPLAKMIALTVLLLSVHWRSRRYVIQRARLYRVLEGIGRWSMLDIYVAALLVALVQWPALTVQVEAGAVAFGAVVVLTMAATLSFDPRLIWDARRDRLRRVAVDGALAPGR